MELTHLDDKGKAVMVDIGQKSVTERVAVASALVRMKPETLSLILDEKIKKGDVFASARIAGIMAAKRTPDLIPMCHPIPITSAVVDLAAVKPDGVLITATVKTTYGTGVEMEALTAASVAALTIYDMCKSVDRAMTVEKVQLIRKSGGKSGDFKREGL
ncbi:MAG TPA: cyclic pyranopterin monophosphate synthase MoaC [Anaerolineaceae bacterium]|nr:cyclic pyranopterin monophosphate synthase MoaC [Anaerolineaceae bacterium]